MANVKIAAHVGVFFPCRRNKRGPSCRRLNRTDVKARPSGAETPDISTDEKFKQLLLSADSLVYPDPAKGSLGGNLLAALISRWGIADQLAAKTQLVDGGDPTGHAVADGKAHFGINQITEIRSVPGLVFLSPLPPASTDKIVMSAAILSGARNPEGGAAWISFITGPAAATVIKAIGMEPVSK